jgi:hypothetical protein
VIEVPLIWLVTVIAGSGVAGVAFVSERKQQRRRGAERRSVLSACGVADVEVARNGTAVGRQGAITLRLETYARRYERGTRLLVEGLSRDIDIAREGPLAWIGHALGERDVRIGSPVFDDSLALRGSPVTIRALLDAGTRGRVLRAFGEHASLRIVEGVLSAEFEEHDGSGAPLASKLDDLIALAHALTPPMSREARLAAVAGSDDVPAVRAAALRALVESAPDHADTGAALRAAARDTEPAIRLQAARALGAEGEPTLRALVAATNVDDEVAAEAVAALGPRLTPEDARPVLVRAAAVGKERLALAALRVVAQGGPAETPGIAAVLAGARGALAVAAADALVATGGPAAEAPLVEALGAREDAVAAAAARALEHCGTVASVPDLQRAEERGGAVRRVARTAVAAIQSRLTGATPGQVSLAGGEAGQISVADSADGRVSFRSED